MRFHSYPCIATSAEVWAVLRARHSEEMDVFSTFSNPDGGVMETTYGLKGSDWPLIGAKTTWRLEPGHYARQDEKTEYWLFMNMENNDE